MGIFELLGWATPRERVGSDTEAVRRIATALERLPPPQARYIAAFAYLLSRVANADMEISAEETAEMERIVREVGGLPEDQAVLVVQMAKTHNALFGGTENFLVTREFNTLADHEQKVRLLHCLFAVSAADTSVSTVEDNTISKIAGELLLDHRDFIAVKRAYRDSLAVLKKDPRREG